VKVGPNQRVRRGDDGGRERASSKVQNQELESDEHDGIVEYSWLDLWPRPREISTTILATRSRYWDCDCSIERGVGGSHCPQSQRYPPTQSFWWECVVSLANELQLLSLYGR